MKRRAVSLEFLAFALALMLMAAVGAVSYHSTVTSAEQSAEMDVNQDLLLLLAQARLAMREGLAQQRTYLLTGDERFLLDFGKKSSEVPRLMEEIRKLEEGNPVQAARARALEERLMARIHRLEEQARRRSEEAATGIIDPELERKEQQEVVAAFEALRGEELRLLGVRSSSTARSIMKTKILLIAANLLAFGLLLWAFGKLRRDNVARRRAEQDLSIANQQLGNLVQNAEQRRAEIETLAEMTAGLHSCLHLEEMGPVMNQIRSRLWPGTGGAIYLFGPSRGSLQRVASWPEDWTLAESFPPSACWAIRRGQLNHFRQGEAGQKCPHYQGSAESLCMPLVAGEEVVGILVSEGRPGSIPPEWERVVTAAAGPIGLAVSNLELRERLRSESVRDPLTDLFNRRYLEEILAKECARATRSGKPIGVIFADIDHFKRINDSEGHPAGDAVLRQFGAVLKNSVRGGDFACRWGGEEFVLVLPESPAEATRLRAEALRESFAQLRVIHAGRELQPVTVSFGVSAFPADGTTPQELIRGADEALYRAKLSGRNRVEIAHDNVAARTPT